MPIGACEYRPVAGYGGKYLVSPQGEIVHAHKTKFRAIKTVTKNGAVLVRLTDNTGKRNEHKVARLVAGAYIPTQDAERLSVAHRNGMKSDNHVGNLYWISKRALGARSGAESSRRVVVKIDRDGGTVSIYASAREAGRMNHMSYQAVLDRCHGRIKKPFALDGYDYRFED